MMEDVRIVGATKIDSVLAQMRAMLKAHEDGAGVRINDVAIIVDLSETVPGEEYSSGSLLYSCSDDRAWVQSAFFSQASMAVSYESVPTEDEQ